MLGGDGRPGATRWLAYRTPLTAPVARIFCLPFAGAANTRNVFLSSPDPD
jgi:hypothetical protein